MFAIISVHCHAIVSFLHPQSIMGFLKISCKNAIKFKTSFLTKVYSTGKQGCDHSASILQWQPASGHKRCRQNCWTGSAENHQRAHSCITCIRTREEVQWDHPSIWPGWWHIWCLRPWGKPSFANISSRSFFWKVYSEKAPTWADEKDLSNEDFLPSDLLLLLCFQVSNWRRSVQLWLRDLLL